MGVGDSKTNPDLFFSSFCCCCCCYGCLDEAILKLFKWILEKLNKYVEVVGAQGLTVEEGTHENWGKARKNPTVMNWNWRKWYNFVISKMCQHVCVCMYPCKPIYVYMCVCKCIYTCICFLFTKRV